MGWSVGRAVLGKNIEIVGDGLPDCVVLAGVDEEEAAAARPRCTRANRTDLIVMVNRLTALIDRE